MDDAATSSTTISSVIEELDKAVAENLNGLTGGVEQASTEQSSILDLLNQLQDQLRQHGDVAVDGIRLDWTGTAISLPSWLPRALTDTIGIRGSISASEALSRAVRKPSNRLGLADIGSRTCSGI